MDGYKHRIMDILLEKKLQAKGAVFIEGPKWCGKTTTAEEIASSKIMQARTDVKNKVHPINTYFFSCIASILSSKNFSSLYP